jgi:hypothetical protein
VAEAKDSIATWQTIAERTRNDLVKERDARSTLAQQHESLTTSHFKLARDLHRGMGGGGDHVTEGRDFGTLLPTQLARLEELGRKSMAPVATWIC